MLGELPGPAGALPPTGESGEIRYVGVFTVVDGRISSQRVYLDRLMVLETTGTLAAAVSG
jgi:ketosteroid isomerase-like protein